VYKFYSQYNSIHKNDIGDLCFELLTDKFNFEQSTSFQKKPEKHLICSKSPVTKLFCYVFVFN
jgi:hypothetical protein